MPRKAGDIRIRVDMTKADDGRLDVVATNIATGAVPPITL